MESAIEGEYETSMDIGSKTRRVFQKYFLLLHSQNGRKHIYIERQTQTQCMEIQHSGNDDDDDGYDSFVSR